MIEILLGGIVGLICGAMGMWLWQRKIIKALESAFNEKIEKQRLENQSLNEKLEQQRVGNQSLSVALAESKGAIQSLESTYKQRFLDMQEGFEARSKEEKRHYEARINEQREYFAKTLDSIQNQYKLTQEEIQQKEAQNKEELKNAFKALGADILEQNKQKFAQEQVLSLQPLREEITKFAKQLSDNHIDSIKQHSALVAQIEQLHKLNMQLSNDAQSLTQALKGENKKQGNWGEIILQKVLENSGLREGREYELQVNMHDDEHRALRPDAVIRLPQSNGEQRCVIVDAKTSLLAYEKLCNATDSEEKERAQKELVASIRNHFNNLSAKNYQQYLEGQKLDFVLMFIPIEGAFLEAMTQNMNLYNEAYQKKVVLVSPTTIMAVLRIIHNLWNIEYRNKESDKIFAEIQKLFSAIERFEGSLNALWRNIDTLNKTREDVKIKYEGNQGIAKKSQAIQNLLKGAGVTELKDSTNGQESLLEE